MHIRRFDFIIVYISVINLVIFAILNNAAQFMGKHHTLCFIHYERRMLWQEIHVYWCCSSMKGHTDIYFTIRIYGQQRQQPVASTATRQTTLHDTLSHICCMCTAVMLQRGIIVFREINPSHCFSHHHYWPAEQEHRRLLPCKYIVHFGWKGSHLNIKISINLVSSSYQLPASWRRVAPVDICTLLRHSSLTPIKLLFPLFWSARHHASL